MIECSFLIPMRRDAETSDGKPHAKKAWYWLKRVLMKRFGGMTKTPGEHIGVWRSPKTQREIVDQSKKYTVAVPKEKLPELRNILRMACREFGQQ